MTARRFPAPEDGVPSAAMRAAFGEDGFLVLEGFATMSDCAELMARAKELVAAFEPGEAPTVFSSHGRAHDRARYFEESGDKVRFFFEEDATDGAGRLCVPKERAINKIGHALHDLEPAFEAFSYRPALANLARGLGLEAALALQSMVIFKQPRIGGEVIWHQDATYLYTRPSSVIGFWFALEQATLENGCLWAIPGGHKLGLKARHYRKDGKLTTETLDPTPWPEDAGVALEVPVGTCVVLHGMLPHSSAPNRSARSRIAYSLHVIDGASDYLDDNWLQRGLEMPLRAL